MLLKEFLENTPPYQEVEVEDINKGSSNQCGPNMPEIFIYCTNCDGDRFFNTSSSLIFGNKITIHNYIFRCKNCNLTQKTITVIGRTTKDMVLGVIQKIGEFPPYGKPTPAKLISLIGPDKDIFIKGRRCENQGLGIGSYAYYRRVVEFQKNRIIDQIISICSKYENMEELIKQLESAKNEPQFSKAISLVSSNLPTSLLIDGRNPLKLLHKALSKGIHEMSDEECLEKANSIRILLTELSLRISEILKDEKELKKAISILDKL